MSDKIDAPVCVRMTTRERSMMRELARQSGAKSMSHFIRALLRKAYAESLEKRIGAFTVIISAPGDACGGTRKLHSGGRCPGCRACS